MGSRRFRGSFPVGGIAGVVTLIQGKATLLEFGSSALGFLCCGEWIPHR